jgi:hypothetical protein
MEDLNIKRITKTKPVKEYLFSICTIVNDTQEYDLMKSVFIEKGFNKQCEYIIADNCLQNEFDAYQAISQFIKISKGEYIIIVHQDVRLIDNIEKLTNCLESLTIKDPLWAICGNAGFYNYGEHKFYITHKDLVQERNDLPQRVKSLDENLLILNASSNITISPDLSGFHLYGTDLCTIARFLGYNCYVIEFMVLHLSGGNTKSLKEYQPTFIEKYGEKMDMGFIQTPCTYLYLSNSRKKNVLYNSKFFFPVIFFLVRKPIQIKRWIKKHKRISIIYKYLFNKEP